MKRSLLEVLCCPYEKADLKFEQLKAEGDIIFDGILTCTACNRYYPIIDEIPMMLPDELRDETMEKEWAKKSRLNQAWIEVLDYTYTRPETRPQTRVPF